MKKGKTQANKSMKNFSTVNQKQIMFSPADEDLNIGPLWQGKLHNKSIVQELRTKIFEKQINTKHALWKLMNLLEEEANASPFFYTTESIASNLKTSPPKLEKIFKMIKDKEYDIVRTHFSSTGFKTNASYNEIENIFKDFY